MTNNKLIEDKTFFLALVIESASNAMVMADEVGNIQLVNKATENLFGYGRQELMEMSVEALLPERFRGKHPEHRANFHKDPKARSMGLGRDLYGLKKDGHEVPIEIGLNPIEAKGNRYVLASIIDISGRKYIEEKEKQFSQELERKIKELDRSNRELEQFAYVASHDLQEPIRKIVGFSQLLARNLEGQLEVETKENLDFVIDGAKRMQILIQDLLAYSRIGRKELKLEVLDFNAVVHEAVSNLELIIKEKRAEIICRQLPCLRAHKTFMVQIFQNLIGNSLKYQSKETPHVEISAQQNENLWEFSVADNGIGIDPRFADKLFVIFQRLHGKDKYGGTGIGLAVSKRMVEKHGGRIWLEPHDGEGAIFKFILPNHDS